MGDYQVVCPDPPWDYKDPGAIRTYRGTRRATAEAHYGCVPLADLIAMRPQVEEWMAPDCAVPMWVTAPKIPDALQLAEGWGLEFVTVLLVWLKTKPKLQEGQLLLSVPTSLDALFHCGMGFYSRSATEFVFLFRRGKPDIPDDRTVGQVIAEPIREHSRKPEEAYRRIERLWPGPAVKRLEMFARCRRPGWDAWGNETEKFGGEDEFGGAS